MTADDRPRSGDSHEHCWCNEATRAAATASCARTYNGWRTWATWNAISTLTAEEQVYAAAVEHARQASDAEAFSTWAWPRYAAMLRDAGYGDPEAYAEPDAIDWAEVWEALRAD